MKLFYPLKLKIARYPYRKRGTHHGWIIAPVDIPVGPIISQMMRWLEAVAMQPSLPRHELVELGNHQWRSMDSAYDNLLLNSESFQVVANLLSHFRQAQSLLDGTISQSQAPGFLNKTFTPALLPFRVAFMHMNCDRSIGSFESSREGMSQYVSWKRQSFWKKTLFCSNDFQEICRFWTFSSQIKSHLIATS